MNKITQIVQRVRSSDNKVAIHAVERLREHGWLERGTLAGANLRYVHLQRANLHKANFTKTDLSMADLRIMVYAAKLMVGIAGRVPLRRPFCL